MAPGVDARSASVGSTAAISEAMEANRVLVAELQSLEQSLVQEEAKLLAKMQSIRRRMALRRAQQAMDSLLPPEPERKVVDPFTKGPRSRKKLSEVAVRSYIRQQVSFFTDEEQCEPKRGRPKKKQKKTVEASDDEDIEKAILGAMSEPPLNADTEYLRSHSHESFVAGPPTIFTARERKVLKDFAEDFYMTHSPDEEIPLEEWNGIQNWQEMRKSRQLPIERSGFACKLWYDLHDSPKVRLGAWTKQEDAALRRLAKGEVDPSLVNQWHEIAKRMPIQGRPAAHCLTRYQTTLCAGNTKSAFTPEEDQILREAVPVFGEKWNVIADLLDGRVSEQIRHRWQLSLAPGIRRGKFSVIEDRRMILALRVYASSDGEFNHDKVAWNEICHHIPGRTQPAIRDRYFNCLNPDLSFRKFTKQEDQIILARVRQWGIESARLWPRLAAELGDRSDSQVCRRWRFLDPEGYEKRRRALEEASKTQTTAVFRRRSIHRHQPQYSKKHTTRSSYNGNAVEPTLMRLSGPILRIHANGTATLHGTELLQVREGENGSTEFILSLQLPRNQPSNKSDVKNGGAFNQRYTNEAVNAGVSWVVTKFDVEKCEYPIQDGRRLQPVVTSTKATRCYRPKEWSPEAEEAFRVQQTGWRDIKEYMETYGEPERWHNGFVRCTRVKANGYYTYWRPHRECDDKYLHTVKLFEYA